jgi:lipopolysaccharide assembly protein A
MQFLKTLFWVILVVALVLFAEANWNMVTIDLWGNLQADVKLPVLVIGAFLLGFVPTFIIYRARIWSLRRRLETQGQVHVANFPGAGPPGRPGAGPPGAPETVRPAAPSGTERPGA